VIGHEFFFLNGATHMARRVSPHGVLLFQFAFADTCSTITWGVVGRMVSRATCSTTAVSAFNPIIGH
jgi:hypothetical protein